MSNTRLISVGYERRSPEEFLAIMVENGVSKVLDVRELPLSRRKGFSKSALSALLREAGIDYVHFKKGGNPHRKLKFDIEHCLSMYAKHLSEHPSILSSFVEELAEDCVAVLCYEREHNLCHRSVLVKKVRRRAEFVLVEID